MAVDASLLTVVARGGGQFAPGRSQKNGTVIGEDWFVHGNVSLLSIDGNVTIKSESYDFKMKALYRIVRNTETLIGSWKAGPGTQFNISFDGSPRVIAKHTNTIN